MMNFETDSLLKKFLDNGTFTGIDAIHAERACLKFEEAQEARKLKQEIRNTMMKNMNARCPLKGRKAPVPYGNPVYSLPRDRQRISLRTVAWYCGHLCWIDRKLTYTKKGSRSYYSIRKEN